MINRWWKRRAISVPVYILYLAVVFGGPIRVFLWYRYGVPLTELAVTVPTHTVFFDGLAASGVLEADKSHYNVVLLGASTAGQMAPEFQRELERIYDSRLRFYNLTTCGHTSRDSLLKYQTIAHKKIDLVLIYDGFNELKFNYTPSFHSDYTHIDRYFEINQRDMGGRVFITDFLKIWGRNCPSDNLRPEFLCYGDTIKTDASLRDNLEQISAACRRRLVLMTFAYRLPTDYVEKHKLGVIMYSPGEFGMAPDKWGRLEDIPRIMNAHNAAIRDVASRRGLMLVDLERELPATKENFCDVCHLSPAGIKEAVRIIGRHLH